MWDLIVSVPDHCLSFTLQYTFELVLFIQKQNVIYTTVYYLLYNGHLSVCIVLYALHWAFL